MYSRFKFCFLKNYWLASIHQVTIDMDPIESEQSFDTIARLFQIKRFCRSRQLLQRFPKVFNVFLVYLSFYLILHHDFPSMDQNDFCCHSLLLSLTNFLSNKIIQYNLYEFYFCHLINDHSPITTLWKVDWNSLYITSCQWLRID